MKKVLVTGAAGIIGLNVIKFLLSEGKYEITLVDLKNKHSMEVLKKYTKRVNVIYGDVNNETLMEALVKDHDVVIHLAGALPPLANLKSELSRIVDYEGTKNIVDAIRMYNPKCQLLYVSSTTVYGKEDNNEKLTVKSAVEIHEGDYFSQYKYDCEKLISGNVKNYTIFRIPVVLGDANNDLPMYNVPKNSCIEFVGAKDVAYALVSAIDYRDKINQKTYNLSGGEECRTTYREYLKNLLSIYGLSFRYIISCLLVEKNFYSGFYKDGNDFSKIVDYRNDSLNAYYRRLKAKYHGSRRLIQRILAKPFCRK